MKIFTIGVYNSTEEQFFKKLIDNNIDTFCDIRQRRGMRGCQYSFVNSNYLQERLRRMDIRYGYIPQLAPTTEIRDKQRQEDEQRGEHKRDRNKLGEMFINEYGKKILEHFDFDAFVEQLDDMGAKNVVFLCVEEKAEACHRSLVAQEMNRRYNYEVVNL